MNLHVRRCGAFFRSILFLLSVSVVTVDVSAKTPMHFGCIEFPPFCYSENGEIKGLEIDDAKRIFRKLGIPLRFTLFPLKRLYKLLSSGDVDVIIGSPMAPDLKGAILWTPQTFYTFTIVAVHLKTAKKIEIIDNLRGKNIGWLRPYTFPVVGSYIKENKIEYSEVGNLKGALKMLELKRLDYFLAYKEELEILGALKKGNIGVSELHKIDLHFIVSKKVPNAKDLLDRVIKIESGSK